MSSQDIVGILLAAGAGTRFGADKLLHPLVDGIPLGMVSACNLRQACPRCVVVLRPEQETLANLLALEGTAIHFSPDAHLGMGHSLAGAVRAIPDAAGWVVALADMPFIDPATIRAVADALKNGASLAAPFYNGRRGHPVGFSRRWFDSLANLQGDHGARDLLASQAESLVRVACKDPGVLMDVDTPAALHSPRLQGVAA